MGGGRPRVLRGEVSLRSSLLVRAATEVGGGSESLLVSTMLPPPPTAPRTSQGYRVLYQASASQLSPPPPVTHTPLHIFQVLGRFPAREVDSHLKPVPPCC